MTLTTTYRNKDISKLLSPSAVAVIGASTNPKSISGQPLAHMINCKYEGGLYPVNPQRSEVQGRKSYASVLDIPEQCDVAVIAVPRAHVPKALDDCGKAGIPFAVILTAGFIETGDDAGAADRVAALQTWYATAPVSPYCKLPTSTGLMIARADKLPAPVVALAWDVEYPLATVDTAALNNFLATHGDRGPEPMCNAAAAAAGQSISPDMTSASPTP